MRNEQWKTWGASVCGSFHRKNELPNQDAYLLKQYRWGDVVVVADGVGSRSNSATGAQSICRAVVDAARFRQTLQNSTEQDFLRLIHAYWRMRIAPYDPDTCSTTCLFVVRRDRQLLLGRLGDGMIVAVGKADSGTFIMQERKESFSNMTHAIGPEFDAEAWELRSLTTSDYDTFLLCTDGVSEDIRPEKQVEFTLKVCSGFCGRSGRPVKTSTVKQWLNRWPVPGLSDDRTIACLYSDKSQGDAPTKVRTS